MRERLWPIEIKYCGVAGVWICTQQVEGKTKLCDLEVACNCFFFNKKKLIILLSCFLSEVQKIRNLGYVAIKRFVVSSWGPEVASVVRLWGDDKISISLYNLRGKEDGFSDSRINICRWRKEMSQYIRKKYDKFSTA